ncbi:hypothetical protein K7X08_013751 [Anisodus acutangulus]|uniref:Uncharacterized protein n=1 Tax=Anisodus acutangulus TaxID=402998 RepID=A0A9Q1R453_9SOLA|nr:hypothetical protein K7X08_013751 [Anisodus acutangulus]
MIVILELNEDGFNQTHFSCSKLHLSGRIFLYSRKLNGGSRFNFYLWQKLQQTIKQVATSTQLQIWREASAVRGDQANRFRIVFFGEQWCPAVTESIIYFGIGFSGEQWCPTATEGMTSLLAQ